MFTDEARFGRINRPRPCWAPIGTRPEVASQLIREYIYLYGAACPKDGTCVYLIMPTSNTACFQIFLNVLSRKFAANLFWFSDGQWARIEPFIPSNRRGVKPKNNRRILSGIMHVLESGCRWVDCPPEYGPAKTVYNRFNRWSAQGIWQSIFEAAAEPAEPPERMALDSTHVKAHRCAGGGKGGRRNRRLASPRAGATARFTALSISCAARGS